MPRALVLFLAIWAGAFATVAAEVRVHDAAGFRAAVAAATPGTRIVLAAGNYGGGYQFAQLRGVEGNTFVGGGAPVAFVGVDGAVVRFNTMEKPGRWALRILQENKAAGFVPSRQGEFVDNVVVFESARWAEGGVNLGAGTAPGTFTFARNWWYCADDPARSRPRLPTPETDGVYGQNPDTARGRAGADAWRERK